MVDIHSEEYILGQNIRKYRLRLGWSQADLSNAVDIDRADISKYENGAKGIMSSSLLRKFAKTLGVSMDALMDEEEPENTAASIQEKYEKLSSRHQEMVKETIDAFLFQESHVAMAGKVPYRSKVSVRYFFAFFTADIGLSQSRHENVANSPQKCGLSAICKSLSNW